MSRPLGDDGGKVAVVTGGAGAIGAAIASAMSVAGVRVAVWDLDGGRAAEVASYLDGDAAGVEVDITSRSSVLSAAATAESELGPLETVPQALTQRTPPACRGVSERCNERCNAPHVQGWIPYNSTGTWKALVRLLTRAFVRTPPGTRTQNLRIKSPLLCQLS